MSGRRSPRTTAACVALGAALLAGCASAPRERIAERLDEATGTTLTVLRAPLELLAARARSHDADPFAWLAPFETNRMGDRSTLLWISVPGGSMRAAPQLLVDGAPLAVAPAPPDPTALGLSQPPYQPPAPWNLQYHYRLDATGLARLAAARELAILVAYDTGPERFVAGTAAAAVLADFVRREH